MTIYEIILTCTSVFTALTTAYFMWRQYRMQCKQREEVAGIQQQIAMPIRFGIVAERDFPIHVTDMIKIEYIDMYKVNRVLYYFNMQEIPQWLYEKMQLGVQDFTFGALDISELSVDRVIDEILKFKHRLPYNA